MKLGTPVMPRRLFLSLVSCLLGASAFAGLTVKDKRPPLVFERDLASVIRVSGREREVIWFMTQYQTALWPDWRSNIGAVADVQQSVASVRRYGHANFYCPMNTTDEHCRAFIYALGMLLHETGQTAPEWFNPS